MNANHWSGCGSSEHRTDVFGHDYCACCGCLMHPRACSTEAVEPASLEGETNEDRSMALVTPPGPLDAAKERRNG